MSAQHTPGPWSYNGATDIHAGESSGFTICEIYPSDSKTRMGKANARLIAASPELLEALDGILAITDRDHVAWDKARAAIAKAKGSK